MKTQVKAVEAIEVGRAGSEGEHIFIGVPEELHEQCTKPLSGAIVHTFRFAPEDVHWLIGALRKELANDPDGDEHDYVDEQLVHHTTPFNRQLGGEYRIKSLATFKKMWEATRDHDQRAAIEAAILVLTADLSDHSEIGMDWDLPCLCHECRSCG